MGGQPFWGLVSGLATAWVRGRDRVLTRHKGCDMRLAGSEITCWGGGEWISI